MCPCPWLQIRRRGLLTVLWCGRQRNLPALGVPVRPTSARIALPPICSGHIDRSFEQPVEPRQAKCEDAAQKPNLGHNVRVIGSPGADQAMPARRLPSPRRRQAVGALVAGGGHPPPHPAGPPPPPPGGPRPPGAGP